MNMESPPRVENIDLTEARAEVEKIIEHLESDLHLELTPDVTSLYNEMINENLLARVENIESVVECIDEDRPIKVGSEDKHYANSVAASLDGLRIALAEGDAPGPVRMLIGLDAKAMIGFTSDHLKVSEIDDNEFDLRDTNMRKALCRHVSGEIRHEDIKYVVLRIPRRLFPKEKLLPIEAENIGPFIFRGTKILRNASNTEENIRLAA